ncbi:MAG: hypothetical protein QG633_162 [Patescibacteria group bacterium]|jgi:photosystem II stability/assembly factor-like uncharacterized protein|nr:hypothetical protein [Patescibacteria group bacterium]
MKKLLSFLTFSFLTLALVLPSFVFASTAHTWGERHPNGGSGTVVWQEVASDDDGSTLVATFGDFPIFISHDAGITWNSRMPGVPYGLFGGLSRVDSDADGSNLIVAGVRLFTSSDGGVNWTERQPAGNVDSTWVAVASDADGSNLAAVNLSEFVYVSTDGGETWTPHDPGNPDFADFISVDMDSDGSKIIAGSWSLGVWISDDSGDTWTDRSPAGNTTWRVAASDADGSNLMAGGGFGRLYTSSNGGVNWTERQPEGDANALWFSGDSDSDGSHLIVGTGNAGFYTSDDAGVTWVEEQPSGAIDTQWEVASDADGSNFVAAGYSNRYFTSPDTVGPVVSSFDPTDDATEVAVDATFSVTFNEDVATSTGDITLHLASDDSLVETIDVAGPKVTLSDTDTLTIDPTTALELGLEYYFLIDAGIVEDIEGNVSTTGISDPTTWSFTSETLPSVSSFTPADGAVDVALDLLSTGNVYIEFDQNIVAGSGNITLKKASDDSIVVALDVNDPEGYVSFSGTSVSLYFPVSLEYATDYYFLIDATAIEDENGNAYAGISDPTTWNFTTRNTPLPPTFDFERVSVNDEGEEGDDASTDSSLSSDGRYVAFSSSATNLVADDTNGAGDIFVYDRDTDTTERVSVNDLGEEGDGESVQPHISSDGRYVAFSSSATNLIADDTNDRYDIFVYDRDTDTIERVSLGDEGEEGDNNSSVPMISFDGRYVLFQSNATTFVPDDGAGNYDIFVYDRDTDTIERASGGSGGEEGDGNSFSAVISGNGRYVAFSSYATNLIVDDTNGVGDIFVYDRDTDTTERVSMSEEGEEGDGESSNATISFDGRYVVFTSTATNLTDDEITTGNAIFLHDRTLGTNGLIVGSYYSAGDLVLSENADFIVYTGYDEDEYAHVYRYNLLTEAELFITENVGEVEGYGDSYGTFISGDGSVVVFESGNSDLVDDDTNDTYDIFVWEEVIDEETPPAEEEDDNGGSGGSHRRSGGDSSSSENTTLLESLQARVEELKTLLAALLGSSPDSVYTRDLDINSEGSDVTALQLFLIAQNKGPQAQALAVVGATGFFGPLTQAALAEFQLSVGITPAAGYFGPITRAFVNGL